MPCSTRTRVEDGLWSWFVCSCACLCWAASLGFTLSFGVFFPVLMDYFNEDRQKTAWAGSIAIATVFFCGPFAGILVNRFGCRVTCMLGGTICAASLGIASLAESIIVLYFTYSILFGFGTSFMFTSSIVITSRYFKKWLSLATGILSGGAGLGVLAFGPILQTLIDSTGWQNAFRIIAGVVLVVCMSSLTYNPNQEPLTNDESQSISKSSTRDAQPSRTTRKFHLDLSVWKNPTFVLVSISAAVAQFGQYNSQIHLVKYCSDLGIPGDKASKLFIYYGLATAIGRIACGRLCDYQWVRPMYVYQLAEFVVGATVLLVTLGTTYTPLVLYSIVYGLAEGCFITTLNVLILTSVSEAQRAAAVGWQMQLSSVFIVSGPPFAGFIADKLGSYKPAFQMSGCVEILGAAIPLLLLCFKHQDEMGNDQTRETDGQPQNKPMANDDTTDRGEQGALMLDCVTTV